MSHTMQTRKDYCLGCGEIKTIGRKTSGGMFYCNSCWKAAFHAQQNYQTKSTRPTFTITNKTSNNGQYSHPKTHNKYVAQHFKTSPRRTGSRPSALLSQSPKSTGNKVIELMQEITSLNEENISLRSQVDIVLKNNEQLQQENKLLNNLGDGIGKYDYVQIKLENERLMEDAERLSLNVKKVMFELKKMKQENDEQADEIQSLRAEIKQERKTRMFAENKFSAKREHWRFMKEQKDEEIYRLTEQLRKQQGLNTAEILADAMHDFKRAKSAQHQYIGTLYKKRYNTKKNNKQSSYLHERGSNDSKHSSRSNKSQSKTHRKTRDFTQNIARECREGSGSSIHSIESGSSHHSMELLSKRITNVGSSKSALTASGYHDLARNTAILAQKAPMQPVISQAHSVPLTVPIAKKMSLPNNIGMVLHAKEANDEVSDDTDVEDLYNSSHSTSSPHVLTPLNMVNVNRSYGTQIRNERKGNGHRPFRPLYNKVHSDKIHKNATKSDRLSQEIRPELDLSEFVRDKRSSFESEHSSHYSANQ